MNWRDSDQFHNGFSKFQGGHLFLSGLDVNYSCEINDLILPIQVLAVTDNDNCQRTMNNRSLAIYDRFRVAFFERLSSSWTFQDTHAYCRCCGDNIEPDLSSSFSKFISRNMDVFVIAFSIQHFSNSTNKKKPTPRADGTSIIPLSHV